MIGAMIGWALVTLVDFFEDEVEVLGVDGVSAKTFWIKHGTYLFDKNTKWMYQS